MASIKDIKEGSLLSGYTEEHLRHCFKILGQAMEFYGLCQIGRHGEGDERIWLSVSTDKTVLEHEYEQRKKHDTDEVIELVPITAENYFCSLKPLGYNEFDEIWMTFVTLAQVWNDKNEEIKNTLIETKSLLSKLKKGDK